MSFKFFMIVLLIPFGLFCNKLASATRKDNLCKSNKDRCLRCYDCDSLENAGCGDPFTLGDDEQYLEECKAYIKNHIPVCVKYVYKNTTYRKCERLNKKVVDEYCVKKDIEIRMISDAREPKNKDYCGYCMENECNGSDDNIASIFLLLVLIIVLLNFN